MLYRKRKHPLTLIEIMIVIFLIGLIGSVIGYNMKGSLDQGKAFKTEKAIDQIHDILMLEVAKGQPIELVVANPEEFIANSGLVNNPKKLLQDGWGTPLTIRTIRNGTDISIQSENYKNYKAAKNRKLGKLALADEDAEEAQ